MLDFENTSSRGSVQCESFVEGFGQLAIGSEGNATRNKRYLMRCENPAQKITSIEQSSHPQQPARKLAQNLVKRLGVPDVKGSLTTAKQPKSTA
jgi:hypothetical protein